MSEENRVYVRKEKKLSWLERHGLMFGGKAQKGETKTMSMGEMGIAVLADGKLEGRMKALMSFKQEFMQGIESENLETYIANLENRVQLLNDAIVEIAAPYARAGSNRRFAILMRGWAKWFTLGKTGILEVKSWVREAQQTQKPEDGMTRLTDRSSINIRNDVHYLHNFLNMTVFRDGFFALSLCFLTEDVSERAAVVIQSMQPMRSSGIDVNKEAEDLK
jgi:hypothetical protein